MSDQIFKYLKKVEQKKIRSSFKRIKKIEEIIYSIVGGRKKHPAEILLYYYGKDILSLPKIRFFIANNVHINITKRLYRYGDNIPRANAAKKTLAKRVAKRKWISGSNWPRFFVNTLNISSEYIGTPHTGEYYDDIIKANIQAPKLFAYQKEVASHLTTGLKNTPGENRGILSLPTGAGKTRAAVTTILEHLMENSGRDIILWIAHTEELCQQAWDEFKESWQKIPWPEKKADDGLLGLYRAWGTEHINVPEKGRTVIVAGIQKLYAAVVNESFDFSKIKRRLSAVIIDEAHRSIAGSYLDVFKKLDLYKTRKGYVSSPIAMYGLTATPFRSSEEETSRLIRLYGKNNLIYPKSLGKNPIAALQKKNILCRIEAKELKVDDHYKLTYKEKKHFEQFRDFPKSFLKKLGSYPRRNKLIYKHVLKLPKKTSILIFACSVDHAKLLSALFNKAGRNSAYISSGIKKGTRYKMIKEFREGKIKILCNYAVLTTGFDAPKIDALFITRPTSSPVLYEQMVGRGMRGSRVGGKEECLIYDVRDNIIDFDGQLLSYARYINLWQMV